MKILIPGGSGQVGAVLSRGFLADGHEVVILSRSVTTSHTIPNSHAAPNRPRTVRWDGRTLGAWTEELDGADVVINLAGRTVNCRYHNENRRQIMDSRIDSTRVIGEAITAATDPPRVWLQASTATIYAHRFDAANDEMTGIIGGDEPNVPETWNFSIDVARSWERATEGFDLPRTRLVLLRSAITLSPDSGGVFEVLLNLVRRGLGGRQGNGRQFVSWIHDDDFTAAVRWILDHDDLTGPINLASPNPVPNAEFMAELRRAAGVRFGLPATRWMLEVGAFVLRTETELILKSRRVVPGKLFDSGFAFRHPDWPAAAKDLVTRWRENRSKG